MNEPWKGENDEERPSSVFAHLMGVKPQTPEELARRKDDLAAARAIGELVFPTLPLVSTGRPCVKCGETKRQLEYYRATMDLETAKQVGTHGFLLATCRRCSFACVERPLDSEVR